MLAAANAAYPVGSVLQEITFASEISETAAVPERELRRPASIVYINGILTTPRIHRQTAQLVATIVNREIQGIYNQTGTRLVGVNEDSLAAGVSDGIQCVRDVMLNLHLAVQSRGPQFNIVGAGLSERERLSVACALLRSYNSAGAALLGKMYECASNGHRLVIVAHSQGNLITADALYLLNWVRLGSLERMYVVSLASCSATIRIAV